MVENYDCLPLVDGDSLRDENRRCYLDKDDRAEDQLEDWVVGNESPIFEQLAAEAAQLATLGGGLAQLCAGGNVLELEVIG